MIRMQSSGPKLPDNRVALVLVDRVALEVGAEGLVEEVVVTLAERDSVAEDSEAVAKVVSVKQVVEAQVADSAGALPTPVRRAAKASHQPIADCGWRRPQLQRQRLLNRPVQLPVQVQPVQGGPGKPAHSPSA
jgi:hypothetical protein